MVHFSMNMGKTEQLMKENKSLKETCEILSNTDIMRDIKKSLDDINKGRYTKL